MTDPWIAVSVAAALLLIFVLALLVPRRPRTVRAPVTDAKLDGLHQRLEAVEKRQSQTDHDLRGIRMALGNFPTKDLVHALELKVVETSGKVDNISSQLTANTSSLGRIEDFLMKSTAEAIASKIVEGQQ